MDLKTCKFPSYGLSAIGTSVPNKHVVLTKHVVVTKHVALTKHVLPVICYKS